MPELNAPIDSPDDIVNKKYVDDAAAAVAATIPAAVASGISSIPVATRTTNGMMAAADKAKLDDARVALPNERTYYVRQDGSDSNNGLTTGTAFRTVNKFLSMLASMDCKNLVVAVNIGPGTWEENNGGGVLYFTPANTFGARQINITGAGMDQTILRGTNSRGLHSNAPGVPIVLSGVRFENTNISIYAESGAHVTFGNVDFSAASNSHINAYSAQVYANQNYKISGSATSYYHVLAAKGSWFECVNKTITLENTPSFGNRYVMCQRNSQAIIYGGTFVGLATGRRYGVEAQSLLNVQGAGANYLPGDQAGTVDSSSFYT